MPTIEQLSIARTRAARLGYTLLIVAGSHVEVLRGGRLVTKLAEWGDVAGWLDAYERLTQRRIAA